MVFINGFSHFSHYSHFSHFFTLSRKKCESVKSAESVRSLRTDRPFLNNGCQHRTRNTPRNWRFPPTFFHIFHMFLHFKAPLEIDGFHQLFFTLSTRFTLQNTTRNWWFSSTVFHTFHTIHTFHTFSHFLRKSVKVWKVRKVWEVWERIDRSSIMGGCQNRTRNTTRNWRFSPTYLHIFHTFLHFETPLHIDGFHQHFFTFFTCFTLQNTTRNWWFPSTVFHTFHTFHTIHTFHTFSLFLGKSVKVWNLATGWPDGSPKCEPIPAQLPLEIDGFHQQFFTLFALLREIIPAQTPLES